MSKYPSFDKGYFQGSGSDVDSSTKETLRPSHTRCKPHCRPLLPKFTEHYCIVIKPRLHKSCSLSDLNSEYDYQKATEYLLGRELEDAAGQGDVCRHQGKEKKSMSFGLNLKSKKHKKKLEKPESEMFSSNFPDSKSIPYETSVSEMSDKITDEDLNERTKLSFPFKHTPSGNFKVHSNQVVFQSATVGVLLADPTNAKVKVKFEGSKEEPCNSNAESNESPCVPEFIYGPRDKANFTVARAQMDLNNSPVKEDHGKDLKSLGYSMSEAVDWSKVQLPKKADLYQEFYRRIHNHTNPDIIVRIGKDDFQCHLIVLSVYSTYFDTVTERSVDLPPSNVSPQAFQTIYEWMIFCGTESHKMLRRDNILDLFCAAQFLGIKDLEDQCWSFIVNEEMFTEDTAFALFQEARVREMTPVMELMVPRVMRFFLPLLASSDFLKLSVDEVTAFLKSNYICVTSEMEVLMGGVRWLLGDWSGRKRHVIEVMRCVRFGLISPWQLVDLKRNKDNPELLQMIQEHEVQKMVDDGLAYVIIKYWYGNSSKNYYHWIEVLGLTEPAERNWIGEEKNLSSYKDFLKYMEQFQIPKDQMYQQLSILNTPRRNEDSSGLRGGESEKIDMRRPKLDFPFPPNLKGLAEKDKGFPNMSEFFESRRKANDQQGAASRFPASFPSPNEGESSKGGQIQVNPIFQEFPNGRPDQQDLHLRQLQEQKELQEQIERQRVQLLRLQQQQQMLQQQRTSVSNSQSMMPSYSAPRDKFINEMISLHERPAGYEQVEQDGSQNLTSTRNGSETDDLSINTLHRKCSDERMGTAAPSETAGNTLAGSYLAAATAALASSSRNPRSSRTGSPRSPSPRSKLEKFDSEQVDAQASRNKHCYRIDAANSIPYDQQTEMTSRSNLNRISHSMLAPTSKNYMVDGTLFNWERETVLVFGGVDPHTTYGIGNNTGQDINKYDPLTNTWEYVGDIPEPRHHHGVAFYRGRVYVIGGADPREDDAHGKSVVMGSVWSYEPSTRSWISEPSLLLPRKNFGLVVHRMSLFAIGGQDRKGRVLRSVEQYDARSGSWVEVQPLNVGRMGVACAKYREYIWVAGGMTGDRKKPLSRVVECYNSSTNQWTEVALLRFPRCFATLFSMNDKLYLLGGAARLSEKDKSTSSVAAMDTWDWKTREWRQHGEMSIPRHGHALAYLGTQLIIIGGVTTMYMRALSNVESYCCERQSWIRGVAALPSPLSGHGAVTLPPASLM